jgi:hypothetical protein
VGGQNWKKSIGQKFWAESEELFVFSALLSWKALQSASIPTTKS